MTRDELLEHCEKQLDLARHDLAKASASGTVDADAEEAVKTASVCLREARIKIGTPVCCGDLYCLERVSKIGSASR